MCGESKGTDISAGGDILTKNKKGDILTTERPKNAGRAAGNQAKNASAQREDVTRTINKHMDNVSKMLDSTGNTLDIYIGNCRYVPPALQSVKSFLAKHKDIKSLFHNLKTDKETVLSESDIGGLEISPAADAQKYDVGVVPTYIFRIKGKVFKVSGDTDIDDIYQIIISDKFVGKRKKDYFDSETIGNGCQAHIPKFGQAALTQGQKEAINKALMSPDEIHIQIPPFVNIREYDSPQMVMKKMASPEYLPFKKYIVFSNSQKKWAKGMIRSGAVGCCTNCQSESMGKELFPFVQLCSKDMLDKFGVTGVPTVVNFQ